MLEYSIMEMCLMMIHLYRFVLHHILYEVSIRYHATLVGWQDFTGTPRVMYAKQFSCKYLFYFIIKTKHINNIRA